jgi:SAM-dependent methyltransferase
MADLVFGHPRLAQIYDALEPDRPDLEPYARLVAEFEAKTVLDIGCGTGTFACMLAVRGVGVIAVDPAAASLEVARSKRGADLVRWIHGDVTELPPVEVELATMTGNVAQVFITEDQWASTLRCCRDALRPGGHLVFEVRDPARKAWLEWNREQSLQRTVIAGEGAVDTWVEVLEVQRDLVTFRKTFIFERDSTVLTSDSTLRFRGRDEIVETVREAKMSVEEVRDAPDRPDGEFVFIARR